MDLSAISEMSKNFAVNIKEINIVSFPIDAESNGFIAALSSAVLPCLGITEETRYYCNPKGEYCTGCGGCGKASNLQRHQIMMYHTLLAASGLAFTFDYPEDDGVGFHTMPGIQHGWRWDEPFVSELMDFAGLSYERYVNKTTAQMYNMIRKTIDAGYTAICANTKNWASPMEWASCWNVVCGYTDDGLCLMRHGGEIVTQVDSSYDDWIVFTGKTERKHTYRDILERIYHILTDPSHDMLEQEIYRDLSSVTPENAIGLSYKMTGINGVPIETRWHAAEAFCSLDNLLFSLTDNNAVKAEMRKLFFSRYIKNANNDTHSTGWKIWGALNVGPNTGYMPTEESFLRLQLPEVQKELKYLYQFVFDNDRAVAEGIRHALNEMQL